GAGAGLAGPEGVRRCGRAAILRLGRGGACSRTGVWRCLLAWAAAAGASKDRKAAEAKRCGQRTSAHAPIVGPPPAPVNPRVILRDSFNLVGVSARPA